MKKSNIIKSLSLLILIILSSFYSSAHAGVTVWSYNEGPVPKTSSLFKTKEECESNRSIFLKNNIGLTATTCVPSVVDGYPIPAPKDPPIYVDGEIGATQNNTVYKMLVPLPGITCMDSSGKDKTCIGNNIGTYLNFIFKFGIGLCAALAVIMLIIYGITYMGDESVFGKTEAKKKMFGAIIGLIIAIGGWTLLNTINPDLTGKNGLVFDSVNIEVQPNSIFVKPATADNLARCHTISTGDCSVENLSKTFGNKAEAMSKICSMESSGNTNAKSGTDVSKDQPPLPFSFGLFQINLLANGAYIKDSKGEVCGNLFIRNSDGEPIPPAKYINNGVYDAKLKPGMQSKYDDCKTTLLNPTENIRIAKILFDGSINNKNNGSMQPWVGDKAACASAFQ